MAIGFLKVDITPENVMVSYYRNYFVSTDPQEGNTGVVYRYTVASTFASSRKNSRVFLLPVENTRIRQNYPGKINPYERLGLS